MSDGSAGGPVTVTVARRVAPGREADFEEWAAGLTRAGARFPGFLGAGLLRPGRLGGDWHVVYRFDSAAHLARWERSPERARLLADADQLMRTTAVHRTSGLETWFALPGRTAPAPPRWKMFLVSVAAIYTLQVVLNAVLAPVAGAWPPALRVGVIAVAVTASMTWLVMPRLAALLSGWLYPREPPDRPSGRARRAGPR